MLLLIETDDEPVFRLRDREVQPLALADRVTEEAFMLADDASVGRADHAARAERLRDSLFDEALVAFLADEADLLAVGLVRHDEAELLGKLPDHHLGQSAQGHERSLKRLLSQPEEEVGLVLLRIGSLLELSDAGDCVM